MKYNNSRRAHQVGRLAKYMLIGGAAAAFLGLSINAQAQIVCTTANWDVENLLSDANTGTQGNDNRRYGGPCGLRVPVDGDARFVMHESGQQEPSYIARFYAFLNNAGSDPMIIFAAEGGGDDQAQVWYNVPAAGDLTLRVYDQGGSPVDLTYNSIGSGWHSIEFVWSADANADIRFALNSEDPNDDLVATVDTAGLFIESGALGNVGGADTGGYVDYDDFDARRTTRPGRLLVADANDDGAVNVLDVASVYDEISGDAFAPGQPDCDENGAINVLDVACTYDVISGN